MAIQLWELQMNQNQHFHSMTPKTIWFSVAVCFSSIIMLSPQVNAQTDNAKLNRLDQQLKKTLRSQKDLEKLIQKSNQANQKLLKEIEALRTESEKRQQEVLKELKSARKEIANAKKTTEKLHQKLSALENDGGGTKSASGKSKNKATKTPANKQSKASSKRNKTSTASSKKSDSDAAAKVAEKKLSAKRRREKARAAVAARLAELKKKKAAAQKKSSSDKPKPDKEKNTAADQSRPATEQPAATEKKENTSSSGVAGNPDRKLSFDDQLKAIRRIRDQRLEEVADKIRSSYQSKINQLRKDGDSVAADDLEQQMLKDMKENQQQIRTRFQSRIKRLKQALMNSGRF